MAGNWDAGKTILHAQAMEEFTPSHFARDPGRIRSGTTQLPRRFHPCARFDFQNVEGGMQISFYAISEKSGEKLHF